MIVGITGGTGCGKTTALAAIRDMGGTVIDCDRVYHELLERDAGLTAAIAARFPQAAIEGRVDRRVLGNLVFSDKEALKALNGMTHSAVKAEVERRLRPRPPLAAIDAIALFESGLSSLCDFTVAVTAPEQTRIPRLTARDGITPEYAAARIAAQPPQAYFRALCGYTLENTGTRREFYGKCLAFFQQLAILYEKTNKGEPNS